MRLASLLLLWSIGCESSNSNATDAPQIDTVGTIDARPIDAAKACNPLTPFNAPVPVIGFATTDVLTIGRRVSLTADELALYFSGSLNHSRTTLYAAHRDAITDRFEPPNLVPAINAGFPFDPTISSDELTLWFADTGHLYSATRTTTADDFSTPALDLYLDIPGQSVSDFSPFLTADAKHLWFMSSRPPPTPTTSLDVNNFWHATREGRSYTSPMIELGLSSTSTVTYSLPVLSADQLTVYVARSEFHPDSTRPSFSISRSHRNTIYDAFLAPAPVNELTSITGGGFWEIIPDWLSPDNCRLYLTLASVFNNGFDLYIATRLP